MITKHGKRSHVKVLILQTDNKPFDSHSHSVLQNHVSDGSDQSEAEFCKWQFCKVIADGNDCKFMEESLPMIFLFHVSE